MEQQRKFTRIEYAAPVALEVAGNRQPGMTVNISQGGARIDTAPLPEFGASVVLFIDLPGVKETSRIPSIVRWRSERQIGIQFELLRPIEVWAINRMGRQK